MAVSKKKKVKELNYFVLSLSVILLFCFVNIASAANPTVTFVSPTLSSGAYSNSSTLNINLTSEDADGITNITLAAYNSTGVAGSSILGSAINFSGTSQGISISGDYQKNITSGFTYSTWFKPEILSGSRALAGNSQYNTMGVAIAIEHNDISIYTETTGAEAVCGTDTYSLIQTGNWYHGVVTYNGTTIQIYVNGVLRNSCVRTVTNSTNNFRIGGDTMIGYNWAGSIDESAFFTSALNSSQVATLYNSGDGAYSRLSDSPSPQNIWHMDENTGTSVSDEAGLSTGTFFGSPQWVSGNISSTPLLFSATSPLTSIFNLLPDSIYYFNASSFDTLGNLGDSTTINLTVDTTTPLIEFISSTENSGATIYTNIISINVSASDINFANITFNLYNNTRALINSTTFSTSTNYTNFTNLADSTYYYNVTLTDLAGNINSTETRTITIDTVSQLISFVSPTPSNASSQDSTSIFINLSTSVSGQHYSFVDFDKSLALWLTMDNLDSTGSPYDLSYYGLYTNISNAGSQTTGKFGNGWSFNGISQYIEMTDLISGDNRFMDWLLPDRRNNNALPISPPGALTVLGWVNLSSNTTSQTFISKIDYNRRGWELGLTDTGNVTLFLGTTNPSNTLQNGQTGRYNLLTTPLTLNTNQWYHIAFVIDISNNYTSIYIDGVNQTFSEGIGSEGFNYSDDFSNYVPLIIGARINDSDNLQLTRNNFFNGTIDDIVVFDSTLSQNEISSLFNTSETQYYHNFTNIGFMNHSITGYSVNSLGYKGQSNLLIKTYNSSADVTSPTLSFISPTQDGYSKGNITLNISSSDASGRTYSFFSDGLIAWWRFEESNETFFKDDSIYGFNGECHVLQGNSTCPLFTPKGAFGGAYNFDGTNDFIDIQDNSTLTPENITISMWVKTNEQGFRKARYYITFGSFGMKLDDDYYAIRMTSTDGQHLASSYTDSGEWTNYIGTYDGNNLSIYRNGDLIESVSAPFGPWHTSNYAGIGRIPHIISSAGDIEDGLDEILIFNRSLSLSEIKSLYDSSQYSLQRDFTGLTGNQSYTIKSVDSFGNVVTSQLNFTIDDTNPSTNLTLPENNSYYNTAQNFTANLSDNSGLSNATLFIYNSTDSEINSTAFTAISGSLQSIVGVVVSLVDGFYHWFYQVFDLAGNQFLTDNRTITIDTTAPAISFVSPTLSSGTTYYQTSIHANISISDTVGIGTALINLYNSTGLVNTTSGNSSSIFVNFTSLVYGTYYLNATSNDTTGNVNNSETRTITLSAPSSSSTNTESGSGSGGSSWAPITEYTLNETQSLTRTSKNLGVGDKINFVIGTENHVLNITKISNNSAEIIIRSNPITILLKVGESKKLNISSSLYYDLYVKLESISGSKANITLQTINELISSKYKNISYSENSQDISNNQSDTPSEKNLSFIISIIIVILIIVMSLIYYYFYKINPPFNYP